MKKQNYIVHLSALIIFLAITFAYFSPMLKGKVIVAHDTLTYTGMAKEIKDFRSKTGKEALWTNSMFGGMPGYLISVSYSKNYIKKIYNVIPGLISRPAIFVFLYLIGFYLCLLLFGVNQWLSLVGAIAFSFSSYFFIIIEAGHATKSLAIAFMPPIVASIAYTFNKRILIGSILTGLFLSIQIAFNHLQITYYTFLIVLVFGIFKFIEMVKSKEYIRFLKPLVALIFAAILAVGSNFARLYTTFEYGKYSMRGKSELTYNNENKTSGLDKDYATAWSYGIDETLTLLIPNFKGGASGGELSTKSATYELFEKSQGPGYAKQVIKQMPLYWGAQPFTSGPVYAGAVMVFFFVLGLFFIKGRLKWWIVTITIISILLAWGSNFMVLTDFFLDYFPGYNKFRTVSMILVIAEFAIPLLAILTIQKILFEELDRKTLLKHVKYTFYIVGGTTLLFALFPGIFYDFSADSDQRYIKQGAQLFIDALREDRKDILIADSFRSFIFIVISGVIILGFLYKKINRNTAIILFGVIILVDMWSVNKRYLNNDDFTTKRKAETPYMPTQADKLILKDSDIHYRVFNLSVNTFNDASTSYFHKSIGGYHGAKMKRYQELIDYHISKQNMEVLNMLNTKYFIVPGKNKQPEVQVNMNANGNAWFVDNYSLVENADDEILALNNFNSKNEVIIDKRFNSYIEDLEIVKDTNAAIKLIEYSPGELKYQFNSKQNQLTVFSEIYYNKGWIAYVDGIETEHFRANYVLRAMIIPAGKHLIEFKFQPKSYSFGTSIAMISSIILLLLLAAIIVYTIFFENDLVESV